MTEQYVVGKIKAVIDQFYTFPNKEYIEETQLDFIGGVLQTALHLLPNELYFDVKQYIYDKHGYDPGGCKDYQITINEWRHEAAREKEE